MNDTISPPTPDAAKVVKVERWRRSDGTQTAKGAYGGDLEEDVRPPAFSDEALALRFAELHERDLRFVSAWGKWLVYDGDRWALDNTLQHFDRARKICRAAAAGCNKPKLAAALAAAKTVAATSSLARSDRRLAATVDQWDIDPWLFNTGGENEQHR